MPEVFSKKIRQRRTACQIRIVVQKGKIVEYQLAIQGWKKRNDSEEEHASESKKGSQVHWRGITHCQLYARLSATPGATQTRFKYHRTGRFRRVDALENIGNNGALLLDVVAGARRSAFGTSPRGVANLISA